METRKLGFTDLELTRVGLGTWAIGGPWQFGWGPQDDNEAIAAILAGLDEGINWIDTAAVYGCGHSEELVGKALKQTGHKPLIATKCGLLWNNNREKIDCLKKDSVLKECDDSLKRLDIDVIDLYQMHWPEPDSDIEEAFEAMAQLQEKGKVKYLGVSNFNVDQIKRVQKIAPVASLQPPYSMIRRQVEDDLLGFCGQNDIGVVAYSPMQRGLLTGKFSQKRFASLAPDDHRRKSSDFLEPAFSATLELVEGLRPITERNGKTLAQLSISWVLRRSEVTAAIVGARKSEQIKETAQAGDWSLTKDEIEEIETLLTKRQEKLNG
ncbi:MAG: aldo/keto reductase [Planctomycetes bacterium]|nr:aldo/keto reductase [Planctomycetota bacterium]